MLYFKNMVISAVFCPCVVLVRFAGSLGWSCSWAQPGLSGCRGNPSCKCSALVKTHHVSCIIKIHCLKIHWIIKIFTAGNWKICTAGWLYAEQVSGNLSFMGSKSVQVFGAGAGAGEGRGTPQGKDCCPLAAFALCGRDVCMLDVIGYFWNMSDSLLG